MISQTHVVSRSAAQWTVTESRPRVLPGRTPFRREQWIATCEERLRELRPDNSREAIASVAQDLWADVSSFDPVIAAEMEHEAWVCTD